MFGITIEFRPFIGQWLENYLKVKVEALVGLAELEGDTLDKLPLKELIRDIELLRIILKKIRGRCVKCPLSEKILEGNESDEQTYCPTFILRIEEIDQLVSVLSNEQKHIKSYDDTYHHNDRKKTLEMICYIIKTLEQQTREGMEDVCRDCLEPYHKGEHNRSNNRSMLHPEVQCWPTQRHWAADLK